MDYRFSFEGVSTSHPDSDNLITQGGRTCSTPFTCRSPIMIACVSKLLGLPPYTPLGVPSWPCLSIILNTPVLYVREAILMGPLSEVPTTIFSCSKVLFHKSEP
jgi:hypothetical protein